MSEYYCRHKCVFTFLRKRPENQRIRRIWCIHHRCSVDVAAMPCHSPPYYLYVLLLIRFTVITDMTEYCTHGDSRRKKSDILSRRVTFWGLTVTDSDGGGMLGGKKMTGFSDSMRYLLIGLRRGSSLTQRTGRQKVANDMAGIRLASN